MSDQNDGLRSGDASTRKYSRRKGPRKKWVNNFACGHTKIRKTGCDVCATRLPRRRPLEDRLWEKTDRSGGPESCWLWQGACDQNGRAQIAWDGRVQPASRAAWFVTTGTPIPDGLYACHTCDNPKCVNPGHLFPGTASDNQKDCAAKGRNVYGGRGRKLGAEERQAIVDRFNDGLSLCKLADETGVSRRTITHLLETAGAYPRKAS